MSETMHYEELKHIPSFEYHPKLQECGQTSDRLEVMQVNLGKLCNLACKHCHVGAGPDRTEVMAREVMAACLRLLQEWKFSTLDITGGAPEMNPNFEWFIEEAAKIGKHIIVRTNLVILAEEKYKHLMEVYAKHKVEVVCSVPHYEEKDTDRQRGGGVYAKSIQVLRQLNQLGYGKENDFVLNLVYNPGGAFFPPEQSAIEREYRTKLGDRYGIVFNHVYTITNNPIGRFGEFLVRSGNLKGYMDQLYGAFNEDTLETMMCRNQLSVGYDGSLYDCDFNQAAGLKVREHNKITDLVGTRYQKRKICFGKHCYACTAGQGSSCGGATEK